MTENTTTLNSSTTELDSTAPRPDALSLVQFPPEALDRDELMLEVRRLRLRLEALRTQRDERIDQIRMLEAERSGEPSHASGIPTHEWRRRAEESEQMLAALLQTRSMRALRLPRQAYGRLLAARARRDRSPVG